ncbi:MAG: hypothetical protein PUF37_00585 [Prevotellaceae bacterium]|nr:hypothetical protein [Prevotellaceae bacterium]
MKDHSFYNYLLALLAVGLMAAVAQLFGQRAMLYPPIAALATGLLIADHRPWRVQLWQIPVLLSLGAVIGTELSMLLPSFPVWSLLIAFLLSGLLLMAFHSTLFPTVATAMLPIILHLSTWIYPLAVLMIATMMVLIDGSAIRLGWRKREEVQPLRKRPSLNRCRQWLLMTIGILPLLVVADYGGHAALVAPPLMVVFATLCQPGNPLRDHPRRLLRALLLTACCGVVGKEILLTLCGLPLCIVMPLTLLSALYILQRFHLLMPPLAALSLLPFVMKGSVWAYPFFAVVGAGYLLICSRTDWRVLKAVNIIRITENGK